MPQRGSQFAWKDRACTLKKVKEKKITTKMKAIGAMEI